MIIEKGIIKYQIFFKKKQFEILKNQFKTGTRTRLSPKWQKMLAQLREKWRHLIEKMRNLEGR